MVSAVADDGMLLMSRAGVLPLLAYLFCTSSIIIGISVTSFGSNPPEPFEAAVTASNISSSSSPPTVLPSVTCDSLIRLITLDLPVRVCMAMRVGRE